MFVVSGKLIFPMSDSIIELVVILSTPAGINFSKEIGVGKGCMNNCVSFAFFFFFCKWLTHKLGT